MAPVNELREQLMTLLIEQRAALARELILSLEVDSDEDGEQAWADEVTRRAKALLQNQASATGWRESIDRMRANLKAGHAQ